MYNNKYFVPEVGLVQVSLFMLSSKVEVVGPSAAYLL